MVNIKVYVMGNPTNVDNIVTDKELKDFEIERVNPNYAVISYVNNDKAIEHVEDVLNCNIIEYLNSTHDDVCKIAYEADELGTLQSNHNCIPCTFDIDNETMHRVHRELWDLYEEISGSELIDCYGDEFNTKLEVALKDPASRESYENTIKTFANLALDMVNKGAVQVTGNELPERLQEEIKRITTNDIFDFTNNGCAYDFTEDELKYSGYVIEYIGILNYMGLDINRIIPKFEDMFCKLNYDLKSE